MGYPGGTNMLKVVARRLTRARGSDIAVTKTASPGLTIDDVRAAAERVRGEVGETPCLASRTLSQICGCEVFLKFENLQFTASFRSAARSTRWRS